MVEIGEGSGVWLDKPLAIGTMQWGTTWLDSKMGSILTEKEIKDISTFLVDDQGIQCFDTAEGYGGGSSELRLKHARQFCFGPMIVSTKFLPAFWRWSEASFFRALLESNKRLGVECCDFYFIHTPIHPLPLEFWIKCACKAQFQGYIKAIGISNCNADQVQRAHAEALKHGSRIACNQIMFNLLDYNAIELRKTEKVCQDLGIRIMAYSPIAQGLLVDGLTREKFARNRIVRIGGLKWEDLTPLRMKISEIAEKNGKSMAQVCLNWVICHGAIPLVGIRTLDQAKSAVGCLGWKLSSEELESLDQFALCRSTLSKPGWKRFVFLFMISSLILAYRISTFLTGGLQD